MGFDRQSRRRISRSVLYTERVNRSRTPRFNRPRNVVTNPIYWAIALGDIERGDSGLVSLLDSTSSVIPAEDRTAHNDYQATVWQNSQCLITVVDGEFRIIDADAATILLCSTTGTVADSDPSFTATVVKQLDGRFNEAAITAENVFSQEYTSGELFLAFRNEEDKTWIADKIGGSGGGGGTNEVLVRFELTEAMTLVDTDAAAETLTQLLVKTGTAITVHDRVGEWAGEIGYQGIAFRGDNMAGEYDIVFLEGKARWVRGTLNDNLEDGTATLTVEYYWGSAPNGRDPGTTVTVHDLLGEFYWLGANRKCLAVWDEREVKYIVVWGEFPADVFAVDLVQDGGTAGSNAIASCTFTYQASNPVSGENLGDGYMPVHPRPALTQMIAATKGIGHWESGGGLRIFVLDHAFEVPTPRTAYSSVTAVSCNPSVGIDVYKRDVYLPVGSRIDPQYLFQTIICPGLGASPGCGIDDVAGVWNFAPSPDVVGNAAVTCLEAVGTCGMAVDLTEDTTVTIKSFEGISLSHDGMGTLTATVTYRNYIFSLNACGLVVAITDNGTDTEDGTLMTEPCP